MSKLFFCIKWNEEVPNPIFSTFHTLKYANFKFHDKNDASAAANEVSCQIIGRQNGKQCSTFRKHFVSMIAMS